jgi:imidazolonepropionase-like amidohydrolase
LVANAHQAGVGVIAGTDAGNPYCYPGFGIHDELVLLVAGGLTTMQAIQAATRDAATFVGLGDSVGTVTPGKFADLLIVDADPLADIRNTQKIHAIVAAGRYISSEQRAQILADIEAGSAAPALAATTQAVRRRLKPCNCH